ncbi:MAG: phosphomevalonate kinase [Bacillus sp. (in: Bacteria)]|nr:phosphomevalonate kinase [Bacillus sp. (in: firmicutes)]
MTFSSYRVTVPGKLLIAGEYAVIEPNQQAVVIAVNRYITATIEPSKQNKLSLPQFGMDNITWEDSGKEVQFSIVDQRLRFIQNSIMITNQFLRENSVTLYPFHLTIDSALDDPSTGRKYGLGSSAAIVVAVVSAMLMLYGEQEAPPTLAQVFKLSAIAHLKTQKNGSGVDIAASTFGGWLVYSSFNPKWVGDELQEGINLSEFIKKPWPNLAITPIKPPANLTFCVGWTKESASTAPMITAVQKFRARKQEAYSQFLQESSQAVSHLIKSFEENDNQESISSLKQNRNALRMLSKQADITIETSKLKDLCAVAEKYGSGKSSGAGGGDCGIAFIKDVDQIEALKEAWRNTGILPLKLTVSQKGVSVTEYNCEMSLPDYRVSV